MKILSFLFATVVATWAKSTPNFHHQWTKFKVFHHKNYSTPLEELRRLTIFQNNLAKIEEHNLLYENGQVTYTKAPNQFSDWTKEEFMNYVNRGKLSRHQNKKKLGSRWVPSKKAAASSVDWRGTAVTSVKNQGECGSSWSFSTTGVIEGQYAINEGHLVSLSEQNLIDCSIDYGSNACDSGWVNSGYEYIMYNGIMSDSDYPFEGQLGNCRYNNSLSITSLRGYVELPFGNETQLEDAVFNTGPIAVAVDATDELQFYSGGIFYDSTCNDIEINHGVLVVGYGADESGSEYWIVKNSWGTDWGEEGYYRAARNRENNCGIASASSFPGLRPSSSK